MGPMEIKRLQITLNCTMNYIITYDIHTNIRWISCRCIEYNSRSTR